MHSPTIDGLGKHYASTLLFKDISFTLRCGDVLAITGWNGSGKSTLVRFIAGLASPSAGRIELSIDGTIIPKASRRKYLGLVAHAISLYDELPGLENLEFFCKVRGTACNKSMLMDFVAKAGFDE